MTLNWPLLAWGGQRLIKGRSRDIRDLATEVTELAPSETATAAPALHPEGALDRITGLSPWRSWDREQELIAGGARPHAATRAYLIRDVWVSGAYLYKGAGKSQPGYGAARLWNEARRGPDLDRAALVSCYAGSRFFGPFLKDSLPLELLPAPEAGPLITMQTKSYGHAPGYRALFDLPQPQQVARARVGALTFYDDFGQNSAKAARYDILRRRLRANVTGAAATPPAGVYLKRGATGEARMVTNEAALETHLAGLGFDILDPAGMAPQDIARRTLDAPIVISVEGSHMSHVVYTMAAGAALVVLQPPDRFAMAFKEFTDRIGLRFGFVVGDQTAGGFDVSIADVHQLIDRMA